MVNLQRLVILVVLLIAPELSAQDTQPMQAEYEEKQVSVDTGSGVLKGTLLSPINTNVDAVVLIIAGSGPTDRDGNQKNVTNNALKLLAEGLAHSGIASVRYDKRGVGASQVANLDEKDLRFESGIDDALTWLSYLENSKAYKSIAVAGHSEGALIALIASQQAVVNKVISLSGPGRAVNEVLREQLQAQPSSVSDVAIPILDSLVRGETVNDVPEMLHALFRPSIQPYWISFFQYDPKVEIGKLDVPILVLQGSTDIQVPVSDAHRLAEGNPQARLHIIENMNHIFKKSSADRQANIETYNEPNLPIVNELVEHVVDFIKN